VVVVRVGVLAVVSKLLDYIKISGLLIRAFLKS